MPPKRQRSASLEEESNSNSNNNVPNTTTNNENDVVNLSNDKVAQVGSFDNLRQPHRMVRPLAVNRSASPQLAAGKRPKRGGKKNLTIYDAFGPPQGTTPPHPHARGFYQTNATRWEIPTKVRRLLPAGITNAKNYSAMRHAFPQTPEVARIDIPAVWHPAFQEFVQNELWTLPKSFKGTSSDLKSVLLAKKSVVAAGACGGSGGAASGSGSGSGALTMPQVVGRFMIWLRAKHPEKSREGLLCVHSTGSGKTLLGLSALLANWEKRTPDGRPYPIVLCSSAGVTQSNNTSRMAREAIRFFRGFEITEKNAKGELVKRRPFDLNSQYDVARRLAQVKHGNVPVGTLTSDWPTWPAAQAIIERRIRKRLIDGLKTLYHPRTKGDEFKKLFNAQRPLPSFTTLYNMLFDVVPKTSGKPTHDPARFRKNVVVDAQGRIAHGIFVVDEIQVLFSPAATSESAWATNSFPHMERMFSHMRSPRGTWLLALTATPGESEEQLKRVMNMVSASTAGGLPQKLMGLVSYAQLSGDTRGFPKLDVKKACVPMTDWYAELFRHTMQKLAREAPPEEARRMMQTAEAEVADSPETAAEKEKVRRQLQQQQIPQMTLAGRVVRAPNRMKINDGVRRAPRLPPMNKDKAAALQGSWSREYFYTDKFKTHYLEKLLRASTYVFVPPSANEETKALLENVPLGCQVMGKSGAIYVCSPKLMRAASIVLNREGYPGKHYVYANSKNGKKTLAIFARILQGKTLAAAAANNANAGGMTYYCPTSYDASLPSTDAMRFATLDAIHLQRDFPQKTENAIAKGLVKTAFDRRENLNGERIRAVLAMKGDFKAVDLKALRYVHCLGSLADAADLVQLLGRGPRMCSHADLPPARRKVTALLWMTTKHAGHGAEARVMGDLRVFAEAANRYAQGMLPLLEALRDASVDRELYRETLHAKAFDIRTVFESGCQAAPPPRPDARESESGGRNGPRAFKGAMSRRKFDALLDAIRNLAAAGETSKARKTADKARRGLLNPGASLKKDDTEAARRRLRDIMLEAGVAFTLTKGEKRDIQRVTREAKAAAAAERDRARQEALAERMVARKIKMNADGARRAATEARRAMQPPGKPTANMAGRKVAHMGRLWGVRTDRGHWYWSDLGNSRAAEEKRRAQEEAKRAQEEAKRAQDEKKLANREEKRSRAREDKAEKERAQAEKRRVQAEKRERADAEEVARAMERMIRKLAKGDKGQNPKPKPKPNADGNAYRAAQAGKRQKLLDASREARRAAARRRARGGAPTPPTSTPTPRTQTQPKLPRQQTPRQQTPPQPSSQRRLSPDVPAAATPGRNGGAGAVRNVMGAMLNALDGPARSPQAAAGVKRRIGKTPLKLFGIVPNSKPLGFRHLGKNANGGNVMYEVVKGKRILASNGTTFLRHKHDWKPVKK